MIVKAIPLDRIVVGGRTRQEMRNIASLANSIRERGLLQPVVVRPDGDGYALVAGGRRIQAVRSLGRAEIDAHIAESLADELEALLAEGEENTEREGFTPTESVEHAERIRSIVEARAAERRRAGQEAGRAARAKARSAPAEGQIAALEEPAPPQLVVGNFPTTKPEPVHTRDGVAKATGMSGRTLEKARHVVEAARDPQAPEPVRAAAREAQAAMDRTGKVDPAFKKVKQAEAEALVAPVRQYLDAGPGAQQQQRLEWQHEFQKKLTGAFALMGTYSAEQVAANADDDLISELRRLGTNLAGYLERIEALRDRPAGLSLVIGG